MAVNKLTPRPPTSTGVSNDKEPESWGGFKVTSAAALTGKRGFCLALYGMGGSGKTSLAATIRFSKHAGRILDIDIEGGADAIAHIPEIDVISPTSFAQVEKIIDRMAKDETCPYDTVFIDNMSELQNLSIQGICPDGQVQIQHWGQCTAQMLSFTRKCRELANKRGINVIMMVWSEFDKEEANSQWHNHVCFTPSLAKQFPGIITMVGLVTPSPRPPYKRKVSFVATEKTDSKFRVAPTDIAAQIPLELVYGVNDPVLADILDTIHGDKPFPKDKYVPLKASQSND